MNIAQAVARLAELQQALFLCNRAIADLEASATIVNHSASNFFGIAAKSAIAARTKLIEQIQELEASVRGRE